MNRLEQQQEEKFLEFPKMIPPFYRDLDTDLCVPQVAEGWEWCFDPSKAYITEKVDGVNTKLEVTEGLMRIYVRNQKTKGYVEVTLNNPSQKHIYAAVANAVAKRGKRFAEGVHFGEAVGMNLQGNPLKLPNSIWLTFDKASGGVKQYKDYPKTDDFEQWKQWILNLKSLVNPEAEAEGVIFVNKETGQMAKLRKDMFDVKYQPVRRRRKRK